MAPDELAAVGRGADAAAGRAEPPASTGGEEQPAAPPWAEKREENVQLDDQEEELLHSHSPEAEEGESHAKEGFTQ